MVGNMVVAWGVVGRTCRDVVARREGEVLGSWGGKSVVVLALAVLVRGQPAWASELLWGGLLPWVGPWGVVVGVVGG